MIGRKRVHVVVYGRVQGVFFRDFTRKEAERLCLKGWIRNCCDGTVEAVIEGNADNVAEMLHWLHHGPPAARVDEVVIRQEQPVGSEVSFVVRY
jgi:acylphosphatase